MTTKLCLSADEHAAALAALRPRGDAWRNGSSDALQGSVMGGVFAALGAGFARANARFCELVEEFFCSTATLTRDVWAIEYGLPDPCDPFADVCEKVNAVGDTTAAYVAAAALRRGWIVTIREEPTFPRETARAGVARAGAALCGARQGVTWFIGVSAASPAYASPRFTSPRAGRMRAGRFLACGPDIEALRCLVRRIAPAHADLIFTLT